MKYSKTALKELTARYRDVLKKCAFLNAVILMSVVMAGSAGAETYTGHTGPQGALSNSAGEDITINEEATFKDNKTTDHGAGLYYKNGTSETAVIFNSNVTFENNEVLSSATSGSGAGMFISGGNVSLLGDANTFTNNQMNATIDESRKAKVGGGAIANQSYDNDGKGPALDATMVIGKADGSSKNTFTNNYSSTNGGAIMNRAVDDDGNATLAVNGTTTFEKNEAALNGGAIYNVARNGKTATLNLNKGTYTFTENKSAAGGAVYNEGTMTITNAVFGGENVGNIATGTKTSGRTEFKSGNKTLWYESGNGAKGGAIYNAGTIDISGKLSENKAKDLSVDYYASEDSEEVLGQLRLVGAGGAVYNAGTATISGEIAKNEAYNGGAIYNAGTATVGGTFTENEASSWGGAIYNSGNLTVSDNTTFTENKSGSVGGAITNALGTSVLTLGSGVTFTGNEAVNDGGAIGNYKGATLVNGTTFTGNKAQTGTTDTDAIGGGAMSLGAESTTKIANATFESNTSGFNGGAIGTRNAWSANNSAAKLDVTNSTFTGNEAFGTTTSTFKSGTITSTGGNGGALDNHFYNSDAADGYAYVGNSTFTGNKAKNGGAVYNNGIADSAGKVAKLLLKDVTFTDNVATTAGGAIYNAGVATVAANTKDVVFSGNTAAGEANDIYNAGTLDLTAGEGRTISLAGGIDGAAGTLNINGAGTVNVAGALKNQTAVVSLGELILSNGAADGSNLSGSKVTVNSGATINTIDNLINDYTSFITLQNGAQVKGDINFDGDGSADKYAAEEGSTVKYLLGNLIGTVAEGGEKTIQVASNGAKVDISQAKWTSENGLTFNSTNAFDGNMIVKGFSGGIDDAADQSGTVEKTEYNQTSNETLADDITVQNSFELNGQYAGEGKPTGDVPVLALGTHQMEVAEGATLAVDKAVIDGSNTGKLKVASDAKAKINDSYLKNLTIDIAGVFESDPTTYDHDTVNVTGVASFAGDTFTNDSTLNNSSVVNFDAVTFADADSEIQGTGVVNLIGTGTTAFNNTVNTNTIKVANGAKFSGTIVGGTLDTRNGVVETTDLGGITGDAYVDGSLATGKVDAIKSGTIKGVNLASTSYGALGSSATLSATGATFDTSNLEISGNNYFTKQNVTAGTVTFSDKLMNTSGTHALIGTWSNGNFIKASDTYNSTTDSYNGDTGAKTVSDALVALDTAIGSMTGFDTANHYAKNTGDVAVNLKALDTAVYNNRTVDEATSGTEDFQSKMDVNATNKSATLKVKNKTTDTTLAAVTVDGTNQKVITDGVLQANDGLVIAATGKGFDASGNAKTGTLTVGAANAITGTANTLDMGANNLINVGDIASTSLTTNAAASTVAIGGTGYTTTVTGNETVTGNLGVTGATTLTGALTANGGITTTNLTATGTTALKNTTVDGTLGVTGDFAVNTDKFTVDAATGNTVVAGTLGVSGLTTFDTTNGFRFGTGPAVKSVDTNGSAVAAGTATAIATGATVKAGAKNADYNGSTADKNIVANASIGTAIGNLNTAIGDRTAFSTTGGVNYTLAGLNNKDVVGAVSQVASNIGGAVTSTNYVATGNTVNANISALDGQVKIVADKNDVQDKGIANLYTALNGGIYNKPDATVTGATTLSATKADGTTTATNTVEGVNAASTINQAQNTSMSALAGVVDGGSVAATGVRTAGTTLNTGNGANLVAATNTIGTLLNKDGTKTLVDHTRYGDSSTLIVEDSESIVENINRMADAIVTDEGQIKILQDNMITKDGAMTLTNKTINADNNTITNLELDNFKSGVVKTAVGTTGDNNSLVTEKAVRDAITASSESDAAAALAAARADAASTAAGSIGSIIGTKVSNDGNFTDASNSDLIEGKTIVSAIQSTAKQVDTNTAKNGVQDTGISNLANRVGVTYDPATGTVGTTSYSSTNYVANGDSVTTAVGKLDTQTKTNADNIAKNTTNIGSLTYTNSAGVNYGVIAANTDLTTAVSQVASNIGTAITGTTRTVGTTAGTNTVNANIAALDQAIGLDVTSTNYVSKSNSINANISKLDTQVKTNADAIGTINTDISGLKTKVGTATLTTTATDLSGAVNELDKEMGDVSAVFTNAGRGTDVATVLSSMDTELDTATATNTTQTTQLSSLAIQIGGSYDTSGNFTHTPYSSANNFAAATDPITTAISNLDAAIGKAGTLNTGIAGYTGTEVVGAIKQVSANLTNGTVDAKFKDTTVNSLTISGTTYGITHDGIGSFSTVNAGANTSLTNGTLTVGDSTNTSQLTSTALTTGTVNATDVNATTFKAGTYTTLVDGTLTVGDSTSKKSILTSTDLTTGTVNATTVAATDVNATNVTATTGVTIGSGTGATLLTNNTTDGLVVSTGMKVTGNETVTGDLAVGGKTTLTGLLTANGGISTTDITASGDASIGGALAVTGATTLTGALTANGGITTTDLTATGTTSLKDTTVTGVLTVTDGTAANTFAMSGKTVTVDGNTEHVLKTSGDTLVDGYVSAVDGLKVTKLTGTDTYSAVFAVDNTGSITTDMLNTNNTANTITLGKNTSTATTLNGTLAMNAGTQTVNLIDDASVALDSTTAATNATTLATVSTVLKSAENADYTTIGPNVTAATTIGTAINTLDTAIGDRTTLSAANGNLTTGGDIVANLAGLDATLGNVKALDGTTGTQTGNLAPAGSTVADHLTAIDNRMGQITGLYDGSTVHSTNVASTVNGHSNLAVGTTVEDHLVSLDNAVGDQSRYASGDYIKGATNAADAIMALDANASLTEARVRRVEKEMRGGFASMAALSALVPNARAAGDTQLSVGAGAYRDHQGLAIGAFHYFNDNVLANMGLSYGGDKSTVFRAGVTFGW